ncbi:MAG TPA: LPS export ABC transporter ATP-binding protein [Anaerohalosphaeraceae bacterium]|nr:LPS export ABC transporter ATP-binding protein [Anaerohalosphaeraceae bacterium]
MPLLETEGLVKKYSGRSVVDGVKIIVPQRSIVGLLGRNGAGKTTTFRMIIGMTEPDGGRVLLEGMDISRIPMYRRARRGMGYLSQEPSVFGRLTAEENLTAILEMTMPKKSSRRQLVDDLIKRYSLTEVRNTQARLLSGGERRRLEIARAMALQPILLLLDEPFSGVDPITVEELQGEIRRLAAGGVSVLITDHNVERTLEVVDKAYIIDHGKVIAEGTPQEIVRNDLVRRSYLGQSFRMDDFDRPTRTWMG